MKDFRELNRSVSLHNSHPQQVMNQMYWHYIFENGLEFTTEYHNVVATPFEHLEEFLKSNPEYTYYQYHFNPTGSAPTDHRAKNRVFSTILTSENKDSAFTVASDNFNHLNVQIAASTKEKAEALRNKIIDAFPEKKIEVKEKKLKMDFWYMANRPTSVQREIVVPDWEDVKGNYPANVVSQVEELIKIKEPTDESKLIILNGKPGCGKTFLLRTLLWEWKDWATPDFVLDPEALFTSPSYLLNLVLDGDEDEDDDYLYPDSPAINTPTEKKWRVIILEDADNFISVDAKANNCQAMSRLLNILDGLVGQGLRILFIITANEDEQKIHEAVKRPGRCLANIGFEGLTREQAETWMTSRGIDTSKLPAMEAKSVGFNRIADQRYTLAELYHIQKEHTREENTLKDASKKITAKKLQKS